MTMAAQVCMQARQTYRASRRYFASKRITTHIYDDTQQSDKDL